MEESLELPKFNSSKSTDSKSAVSNPFESTRVKSYNHRPNIVPVYVLDTLSQAHYKDQLNNTNVNTNQQDTNSAIKVVHTNHNHGKHKDEEYGSFANDPFIKSMDNDWNKFLSTIKQPTTYTDDVMQYDKDKVFVDKLEGTWGGDERLKSALLGSPTSDDDTYVDNNNSSPFFCFNLFKKLSKPPNDSPKLRSKAGYWMSDEKRADLLPFLKRIFVTNPLVPLLLRICIIFFSACALGLACTIYQFSNSRYDGSKIEQQASTIMAIVVQCLAIVYVAYIAYDEYSGKPLGLRDPLGKMKLIMLDLLFIIFSSANLSLTFNTLYDDEWVCRSDPSSPDDKGSPMVTSICRRQRSLAAFLFLVLNLWLLTFTISIIRVVDRVSVGGQRND